MSTTRVSLADLAAQPHEYSSEELAFRAKATDEDLHQGAVADPDAQPWSDDMFRRARAARRSRLSETPSAPRELLLETADMSSKSPTWIVTDENGEVFYLQAASIRQALPGAIASAVKIVPMPVRGDRTGNPSGREPGR